jgi:RsiW-degrading membrane proteinase PrsW (M82 family)
LRRREVCLLICGALIALVALATVSQFSLVAFMRADIAAVFFRALSLSTLAAAVPLIVLWFLDRRERETFWLFGASFLWGGLIATAIALPFNTAFFRLVDAWVAANPVVIELLGPDATELLAAPISAPIAEELAKAAGVLLLFWLLRAEFDNMRDGYVYGALIGVGFNWYETALYVTMGYAEHGVPPYEVQIGARYALFGLGGHAMFTGIFGALLGVSLQTRYAIIRVVSPVIGLLLAISAHAFFNALPLFAALTRAAAAEPAVDERELIREIGFLEAFQAASLLQLVVFAPFLLILAIALWRSGVWERRVIREELADEVGRGVMPHEYDVILKDRMFRTRRIDDAHPVVSAALVNAQHELAFRKRRVRHEGGDPARDELVAAWRNDIAALRTLASQPAAP